MKAYDLAYANPFSMVTESYNNPAGKRSRIIIRHNPIYKDQKLILRSLGFHFKNINVILNKILILKDVLNNIKQLQLINCHKPQIEHHGHDLHINKFHGHSNLLQVD